MITQNELLRTIKLNENKYSWILGAGCSLCAGLPSAQAIIDDLKKRYYCSEEQIAFNQTDLNISSYRDKIQSFFDALGCPDEWSSEEYSFYFNLLFGDDQKAQHDYIENILNSENARKTKAHNIFAFLMGESIIKSVYTTNFDTVIEDAYAAINQKQLSTFHIEGSYAANNAINNEKYPIYVKLHGDLKYTSLKNLEGDLQEANTELGIAFQNTCNRYGVVVAGYSGRDESVMSLFEEALNHKNSFPHGVYWTTLNPENTSTRVLEFIKKAQEKGKKAELVKIDGFETLSEALWKNSSSYNIDNDKRIAVHKIQKPSIPVGASSKNDPLIRFNALIVNGLPKQVYKLDLEENISWKELKDGLKKIGFNSVGYISDAPYIWAEKEEIERVFPKARSVKLSIMDFQNECMEDSTVIGALEELLCKCLTANKPLRHKAKSKKNYLVPIQDKDLQNQYSSLSKQFNQSAMYGIVKGAKAEITDRKTTRTKLVDVHWTHALQIKLKLIGDRPLLIFHPEILFFPNGKSDQAKTLKRSLIKNRMNKVTNSIFDEWLNILGLRNTKEENIILNKFLARDDCAPQFIVIPKGISSGKKGS